MKQWLNAKEFPNRRTRVPNAPFLCYLSPMSREARHLRIRGRVQGVFFRESMRQEAERLGVTGWVRNRADGSVEAWIQGEQAALHELLAWSRRGPPRAEVSGVEEEPASPDTTLTAFERRETL